MEKLVAVITGASKGIGREIALTMAKEGYDIIVNYRSDQKGAMEVCNIARTYGAKAVAICADVGKMDELEKMFEKIDQIFSKIDVLVNNAGISKEVYFLEATENMFDEMIASDWKGLYFCSQMAAKRMILTNTKGVIVNISSNQVDGCWPRATIYAATKAAVSKFTKNAAMELALDGIRVVAIAPGYTNVGWEEGDIRLDAAKKLPLRRFATTQEIAQGVVYLTSKHANYITGTTLTIDGGATLPVVAANDFVEWR